MPILKCHCCGHSGFDQALLEQNMVVVGTMRRLDGEAVRSCLRIRKAIHIAAEIQRRGSMQDDRRSGFPGFT